jgi:DNA-binding transcriptional ArsR family regulator
VDPTTVTPTPQALRALAHPTRLRMLGMLRLDGPATATTLATRLGINTGQTSYHLRQLAQHGFVVEDTERGNARDRWWRAAHRSTTTESATAADPDEKQTMEAYLQTVAVVMTQNLQRAVEELPLLPRPWAEAVNLSDFVVRLTPARARALVDRVMEELGAEEDEAAEDAVPFVVQLSAFPYPGKAGGDVS